MNTEPEAVPTGYNARHTRLGGSSAVRTTAAFGCGIKINTEGSTVDCRLNPELLLRPVATAPGSVLFDPQA